MRVDLIGISHTKEAHSYQRASNITQNVRSEEYKGFSSDYCYHDERRRHVFDKGSGGKRRSHEQGKVHGIEYKLDIILQIQWKGGFGLGGERREIQTLPAYLCQFPG